MLIMKKSLEIVKLGKGRKGSTVADQNQGPYQSLLYLDPESIKRDTGMKAKDMYANVGH